jgi:hypothetical protein
MAEATNAKPKACERCGFLVPAGEGKVVLRDLPYFDADDEQHVRVKQETVVFHPNPQTCSELNKRAQMQQRIAAQARRLRERIVVRATA